MITYITWNRENPDIAGVYFDETGETLVDSRPDNQLAMTGSKTITTAQQVALKDEFGDDINFYTEAPEGWDAI